MSYADSPKDYWLIRKKWPKRFLWMLVMASVILFFAAPFYCNYTDLSRGRELLLATREAKAKVERALTENPNGKVTLDTLHLIRDALAIKSKEGETIEIPFREITEQGEIRLFSPQLGVMLVLTPSVKDKKIIWSCWGRPLKKVPFSCRGESQND